VALIDGASCKGDDSRLCCDLPAYGQFVIVVGRLKRTGGWWSLADATICTGAKNPLLP
jgi:hypothetical protein